MIELLELCGFSNQEMESEMPRIEKEGGGELMEGMVVNIDIPCLELGWAGVQIEDAVLITSDGFELLTRTDRTLYLL